MKLTIFLMIVSFVLGLIGGALIWRNNALKAEAALKDTIAELLKFKGRVK